MLKRQGGWVFYLNESNNFMRILFVSTDFPYRSTAGTITQGGGGACISQLADGLNKRGYEIEVITRTERDLSDEIYDFPIHRTKYYNLGFRESKITHYLTATKLAREIVSDRHFDIIHTHNPVAGLTGCKISKAFKIPHIMTLHGPWSSVRQRFYTRILARWIEGRALACADLITCDAKSLTQEVNSRYHHDEKVITIPNAVDTHQFSPKIGRQEARDKLGIKTDSLIILYTGRFVEEKGLPYLLEAFDRHSKRVDDTYLLLVGGGFDEHLVSRWLSSHPSISPRVIIFPYLPYSEMPLVYNASDIFVLPSLAEGMSRSIMEAMACGKPVIATNVGGNSELVTPKKTGILVEPRSPEALEYHLTLLTRNGNLRANMGKKAREFIMKHNTVDKRINSFIEAYNHLLK